MSEINPSGAKSKPGGRRASMSPAERKRIAALGAAARWGKADPTADDSAADYVGMEPTEAVLLAATRIFAREGFERPTLKQIAKQAGVGLQTIYRYYPTKRALYLRCCASLLDRYMRYFDGLMDRNDTPATKLYALALGLSDTHIDPTLTRLIHRELLDPSSNTIDSAFGDQLPSYFQHYFDTVRELGVDNDQRRVLALITMIMGMVQFVPVRGNVPDINEIACDIESMSAFALKLAFPSIEWAAVRDEVVFTRFAFS